jgi:hypothetical protein
MHCLPHLASPRARDDLVAHPAINPSISSYRARPIHRSPLLRGVIMGGVDTEALGAAITRAFFLLVFKAPFQSKNNFGVCRAVIRLCTLLQLPFKVWWKAYSKLWI